MSMVLRVLMLVLLALPVQAAETLSGNGKEVTSDKGIQAWLVEDHSQPVVALSFSWPGGLEQDGEAQQGLSLLGAAMLTQGAGADDAAAFQQKLQENAVSLGFSATRDVTVGNMRSLKQTLPQAVALLKAALYQPRFDKDALAREKAEMVSSLENNLSNPEWLLNRLLFRDVFAGHPYANRAYGTPATLASITPEQLRAWHRQHGRNGLVVSVTGDVSEAELKTLLDAVFAGLPEKVADRKPIGEATLQHPHQTLVLTHAGSQSSVIELWPGLKRDDPAWEVGEVLNYILGGGGFSSRLMQEIRDKRGLTYGIQSGDLFFDHAALFTIHAATPNAKVGEVLARVAAEITKLKTDLVTPAELQAAKDYLIGAYPLQLTSSLEVAEHYQALQRLHLPMDEQEKRATALRAVTAEQVRDLARRLFVADQSTILIVGQPEGVKADVTYTKGPKF